MLLNLPTIWFDSTLNILSLIHNTELVCVTIYVFILCYRKMLVLIIFSLSVNQKLFILTILFYTIILLYRLIVKHTNNWFKHRMPCFYFIAIKKTLDKGLLINMKLSALQLSSRDLSFISCIMLSKGAQ